MAGLITDLITKIGEMAGHIEALTELAHAKKDVIIKNDTDSLKAVTAHENTYIGRYQKSERAAALILDDIAMVLNQDRAALTLSKIGELIKEQDDYGEYAASYDRLKTGIDLLKDRNDQNNALIENALEYIDYSVNVLRSTYGNGEDVLDSRS